MFAAEEDNKDTKDDSIPFSTMLIGSIQGSSKQRDPLLVLFDSGSTRTWIHQRVLPKGIQGTSVSKVEGATLSGTLSSSRCVKLSHIALPEFHRQRFIDEASAMVFDATCRYDVIVGRDLLTRIGMSLDFGSKEMIWENVSVAMRPYNILDRHTGMDGVDPELEPTPAMMLFLDAIDETLHGECACGVCDQDVVGEKMNEDAMKVSEISNNNNKDGNDQAEGGSENLGYKSKTIESSSYDKFTADDVIAQCSHLSQQQQNDLRELLSKHSKLFDGRLKQFKYEKVHLELTPDAQPFRTQAYSVPRHHLEIFKEELDRLVEIGVLEPCGRSDWIAGTFIIPKKDGKVRWISDFRGLNQCLRRKVYPLPKISDILSRRPGYEFLTKLDISMCYYTYALDEESKDLCTIATPFGLYRYCRLPMGVSQGPDIAQQLMEDLLRDLIKDLEVYIDDIACFSNSWEEHMELLGKVLRRLEDAGFTINPLKCEWAVKETDFLGYWMTPTGLKPWKKKVESILKMEAPTNITQLRSFLGLVTYYRDMWPRRSHVLAPLTEMTGRTFNWTPNCEAAFKRMKALVAADALLAYPDHNQPFHIETDASDYQLGGVIKQNGRPVAYYTRKLNSAQKNYSTIEKELLSIVETFREFRDILLGSEIHVYTDHKNLTHKLSSFSTQRVLRWRLILEEYGPTFHYKQGDTNFIADALSRVPTSRTERESRHHAFDPFTVSHPSSQLPSDPNDDDAFYSAVFEDEEMFECFMHYPEIDTNGQMTNPTHDEAAVRGRWPMDDVQTRRVRDDEPKVKAPSYETSDY